MPTINQVVAVERGLRSRAGTALTDAHQQLQKNDLFLGISRKYRPKDDDQTKVTGELLPEESKQVVLKAVQVILETNRKQAELLDISAQRDWANCEARADVIVGDRVLIQGAPVTYLLFLEKKLVDLRTFIEKLPKLSLGEEWVHDVNQDLYATKPSESTRTKKVTMPLIMAEATKEHPAQVKEVTEDILVGYWTTVKYSSALPVSQINAMLARVEELQKAVKFARAKANEIQVAKIEVGKTILDFIFAL